MRLRPALDLSLLLASGLAAAQEPPVKAHMEGCLKWRNASEGYAAFNQCDSAVSIKFMLLQDQQVVEGEATPGGNFFGPPGKGGSMIFTACPRGYVPSLRFSVENAQPISVSLYNCRPIDRPDS
jgi:hypothetical protein